MYRKSLTVALVGVCMLAITAVFAEADSKPATVTNARGVVNVVVIEADAEVVTLTAEEEAGQYCAADYEDTKGDDVCCYDPWEDYCVEQEDECDAFFVEVQCPCRSEPTR